MSKVITFSRVFPFYHPKKGEPTYFPAKLMESFRNLPNMKNSTYNIWVELNPNIRPAEIMSHVICEFPMPKKYTPKWHTIRAGHRFKQGDMFSPRMWSNKPYNSKQIIIAPDIEIKKVWDISISLNQRDIVNGKPTMSISINHSEPYKYGSNLSGELATNDGLELVDFKDWFAAGKRDILFEGQIICWNENVEY